MKIFFLISVIIQFFLVHAMANEQVIKINQIEKLTNESIELFNNQKYEEASELLETIKNSRNDFVSWYYYYGLNQMYLKNYDKAIASLQIFINKSNINDTAKAYYYLGYAQFNKSEYEAALNSLDLSLDLSKDSVFDNKTEALIEKTIQYQNYYESNKKNKITFLAGYSYDTDVINLSPLSFTEKLNGHVISCGMSASRKVIDRYNFIFEPSLAVFDNYSLDSTFKSNSTLQSTDALQILLSAPLRFYFEDEELANKFDFSFNIYNVYLPIVTSSRELSLSSFFMKGQVLSPLSSKYAVKFSSQLAVDKSYGYPSDDNDASGLRLDFLSSLIYSPADQNNSSYFYDLGADFSSTKGANTRYQKYSLAMGYSFSSFMQTFSSIKLGAHYLKYPDKATSRTDNQYNFNYSLSKNISDKSGLAFNLNYVNNTSNSDLNKYSDVAVGIQYSYSLGF